MNIRILSVHTEYSYMFSLVTLSHLLEVCSCCCSRQQRQKQTDRNKVL